MSIAFAILGLLLMLAQWRASPEFFRRAEVAPAEGVEERPSAPTAE
jgi:hypothetical protein